MVHKILLFDILLQLHLLSPSTLQFMSIRKDKIKRGKIDEIKEIKPKTYKKKNDK